MSSLLIDEYPLIILPKLAVSIGLNEAIVLQQLHYWTLKAEERKPDSFQDAYERWIPVTHSALEKTFSFWNISTIRRTVASLVDQGMILEQQTGRGKLYRVQYEKVGGLNTQSVQNEHPQDQQNQKNAANEAKIDPTSSPGQPVESDTQKPLRTKEGDHPLQRWVHDNLPNVSKMRTQLSVDECDRLIAEFPKPVIQEILEAMENKADLSKKYTSVNLTLRNWIRMREEKDGRKLRNPSSGRDATEMCTCPTCGERMPLIRKVDHVCPPYNPELVGALANDIGMLASKMRSRDILKQSQEGQTTTMGPLDH